MEDLSLHILDIAENSANAGARNIDISILEDTSQDMLRIQISDDGRGMEPAVLEQVTDPFYTTRTTRRVGLGLALFNEAARAANGSMDVHSIFGKGTTVTATFQLSHIDRKPLGDMADTMVTLVLGNPDVHIVYTQERGGDTFRFDTQDIKAKLGGLSINHGSVLAFIKQYITENVQSLDIQPHEIKEQHA